MVHSNLLKPFKRFGNSTIPLHCKLWLSTYISYRQNCFGHSDRQKFMNFEIYISKFSYGQHSGEFDSEHLRLFFGVTPCLWWNPQIFHSILKIIQAITTKSFEKFTKNLLSFILSFTHFKHCARDKKYFCGFKTIFL